MAETNSMTGAKSPYAQIALTYLRRKMFWIAGVILLFTLIGLTFLAFDQESQQKSQRLYLRGIADPAARESIRAYWAAHHAEVQIASDISNIRTILLGLTWVLVSILIHLKLQIASPRAVIVPHYRRPHLLVAAAFALIPLLLIPLCISAVFAFPPLAVLAVTTLFSALVFWFAYLQKWPLLAILVAFWVSIYTTTGQHALYAFIANTAILPNLLLITVGLVALLALGRRLMHLREEMPEYSRQIPINQWQTMTMPQSPQSPAPQVNYNNPLNRFFCSASYRQLERLAVSPPTSPWARLQRWRLAGNPANFTVIFVPIILVQIFVIARLTGSADMTGSAGIRLWPMELVYFPAFVISQLALVTWRTLGIESLRPITRGAYLRERAAFFALQFAQTWFILAATMLACAAFLQPASLRNPALWLALAASALALFPVFAMLIWVLRLRSPSAIIIAIGLAFGLGSAAVVIFTEPLLALPGPWLAGILLITLLFSALILRDAWRRWLRTDLA